MTSALRLGVNQAHVATIRNARGGVHPDPIHAAKLAEKAGADGITAHLREDRRHISDSDIARLMDAIVLPLNFEIAATDEMLQIAVRHKPHAACIVPEKRKERTTEGGLDVAGGFESLKPFVSTLKDNGILVSLFIEPSEKQLEAAASLNADIVELHTGRYCDTEGTAHDVELKRIIHAARVAEGLGLECHAGHGLTFDTVTPIAKIPSLVELNIGHFLIGEAIFSGLNSAIRRMRSLMDTARTNIAGERSA